MTVTIYHNPGCGTSRGALALIEAAGVEPVIVEYLKQPLSFDQISAVLAAAGLRARDLLRKGGEKYEALGLSDPDIDDAQIIEAMVAHPILMNRPVVVTPKGTRLCRPSERVLDLL